MEPQRLQQPAAPRNGFDRRFEDARELREDTVGIDAGGHLVVSQPGLCDNRAVEIGIAIDLDHPLHKIIERGGIMRGEKTPRVEIASHQRIAPVDRDRIDEHRLDDFLGGVAGMRFILEGDRKPAFRQKGPLVGHAMAECVEHLAAGIDRLVAGELPEEIVARPAERIGHHKSAKSVLARKHGIEIALGRLHEPVGIGVERPQREPEVARMNGVFECEGPIAGEPVGRDVFAGVEDPHAVVFQKIFPPAADAGIDDVVGGVADLHSIPLLQDLRKKIVFGIKVIPEADEADANKRAGIGGLRLGWHGLSPHAPAASSVESRCQRVHSPITKNPAAERQINRSQAGDGRRRWSIAQ